MLPKIDTLVGCMYLEYLKISPGAGCCRSFLRSGVDDAWGNGTPSAPHQRGELMTPVPRLWRAD